MYSLQLNSEGLCISYLDQWESCLACLHLELSLRAYKGRVYPESRVSFDLPLRTFVNLGRSKCEFSSAHEKYGVRTGPKASR